MTSLNTRVAVAKSVAEPLLALEHHLDGAITAYAATLTAAIAGRREARLPLAAGQDGLDQLGLAIGQLIGARKAVHAAHTSFRSVSNEMQVPAVAFGDHGDTPEDFAQTRGETRPALAIASAA